MGRDFAAMHNDPDLHSEEEVCEICGEDPDNCLCPECPICGEIGKRSCFEDHMPQLAPLFADAAKAYLEEQDQRLEREARDRAEWEARWAEDFWEEEEED